MGCCEEARAGLVGCSDDRLIRKTFQLRSVSCIVCLRQRAASSTSMHHSFPPAFMSRQGRIASTARAGAATSIDHNRWTCRILPFAGCGQERYAS